MTDLHATAAQLKADSPQPLAHFTCPTCGKGAVSGSEARPTEGLVTGNYMCPAQHIFTVRWLEETA